MYVLVTKNVSNKGTIIVLEIGGGIYFFLSKNFLREKKLKYKIMAL